MSNTLFVGKVYYHFGELPSTNDWAMELLDAKRWPSHGQPSKTRPPEGTVVRADNQTAGRGQLGSRWQSQPGENLLLSAIFYPNWLEVNTQFCLSMAVALALRDCVAAFTGNQPLAVKWPNDLLLNGNKTAGILIQNTICGSSLQSAVVGIGLNVNQVQFPPDLPKATSMALALGHSLDLADVEAKLFECLEHRYLQLKSGQSNELHAEYEQRLWRIGELTTFLRQPDGSCFDGRILGVTSQGLLRLETNAGEERFELKAVSIGDCLTF